MLSPSLLKWVSVSLLLGIFLAITGCYPDHPQSTFDAAGPVARVQLNLFYWVFWASVFVFVVVEGALLYAVIRFRRKSSTDELPIQSHGNNRLEIAWTIAPAIVLAVVAVPTIQAIVETSTTPPAALEVRVTGHQWWWEFEYLGLDKPLVTANELHIPVGTPIDLKLESKDVIHSFWVPKLGGKTDLFPGTTNEMWLQADEAGTFYGLCAEFCGTAHAQMRLRVIAQPAADFNAWVENYSKAATSPQTDSAKLGEQVFMSNGGCVACHTVNGPPLFAQLGPNLTHVGTRTTLGAGIIDMNKENLIKWLNNPEAVKPGNQMTQLAPIYQSAELALSATEVEALADYLLGLKPSDAQ